MPAFPPIPALIPFPFSVPFPTGAHRTQTALTLATAVLLAAGAPASAQDGGPCPPGETAHPGSFVDPFLEWEREGRQLAFAGTVYEPVRCERDGTTTRHVWVDWTTGAAVDDAARVRELFTAFALLEGLTPEELAERADAFSAMADRRREGEQVFREISRDATMVDVAVEVFTRYLASGTDPSAYFDLDFFGTLYESASRLGTLYGESRPLAPEAVRARIEERQRREVESGFGADAAFLGEMAEGISAMAELYAQRGSGHGYSAGDQNLRSIYDLDQAILDQEASLGWSIVTRLEDTEHVAVASADFAVANRTAYAYTRMIEGVYRAASRGDLASLDPVYTLGDLLPAHHINTLTLLHRYREELEHQQGQLSGAAWALITAFQGGTTAAQALDAAQQSIWDEERMANMDAERLPRALLAAELQARASLAPSTAVADDESDDWWQDVLWRAMRSNDGPGLTQALDEGADPTVRAPDGSTLLEYGLLEGRTTAVRALLESDADLSDLDPDGRALFVVYPEDDDMVRLLLSAGADPNARNPQGSSALGRFLVDDDATLAMLDAGADPNAPVDAEEGLTPLMMAVLAEEEDVAFVLREYGADPQGRDRWGGTILMHSVRRHDVEGDDVEEGQSMGFDPAARDYRGRTILMYSAMRLEESYDAEETIRTLLPYSGSVDTQDEDGWTALMYAVERCSPNMVEGLVAHGADVDLLDRQGLSMFEVASTPPVTLFGHPVVEWEADEWAGRCARTAGLVDRLRDPQVLGGMRVEGLVDALNDELPEVARTLVLVGAPVNQPAGNGSYPIEEAVDEELWDVALLLLDFGADPTLPDRSSLLHAAVEREEATPVLRSMLAAGAPPDWPAYDGDPPLETAMAVDVFPNAETLVEYGARIREEDVMRALDRCMPRYLRLFMDNGATIPVHYDDDADYCSGVVSVARDFGLDFDESGFPEDMTLTPDELIEEGCDQSQPDWVVEGIRQDGNVNQVVAGGGSVLGHCLSEDNWRGALALMDAGADPTWKNQWNQGLLFNATCNKGQETQEHVAVVRRMLQMGAEADDFDDNGQSSIHCAAYEGLTEIVRLLVLAGADPDRLDKGGRTALMYAATYGYEDMARILVDLGAEVNRPNDYQLMALDMALTDYMGEDQSTRDRKARVASYLKSVGGESFEAERIIEAQRAAEEARRREEYEARLRAEQEAMARAQQEALMRAQAEAQRRAMMEAARRRAIMAAQARDRALAEQRRREMEAQAARREPARRPTPQRQDEAYTPAPKKVGHCTLPANPRGTAEQLICSVWEVDTGLDSPTPHRWILQLEPQGQVRVAATIPSTEAHPALMGGITRGYSWRLQGPTLIVEDTSWGSRSRTFRFRVVAPRATTSGTVTTEYGQESIRVHRANTNWW